MVRYVIEEYFGAVRQVLIGRHSHDDAVVVGRVVGIAGAELDDEIIHGLGIVRHVEHHPDDLFGGGPVVVRDGGGDVHLLESTRWAYFDPPFDLVGCDQRDLSPVRDFLLRQVKLKQHDGCRRYPRIFGVVVLERFLHPPHQPRCALRSHDIVALVQLQCLLLLRALLQHLQRNILTHEHIAPLLDNPTLFQCDFLDGVPQYPRMLQPDTGNHRQRRPLHDIRRIQSSSQPGLQHHDLHALAGKHVECQCRRNLEERGGYALPFANVEYLLEVTFDLRFGDGSAVDLYAFAEGGDVGGDEESYLVVGTLERVGGFEGYGSLAVGAGDVYYRYVGLIHGTSQQLVQLIHILQP
mmetsp:Transcript_383/g.823  ORF Transcript_383/g.823 Transcript_383/m.823 type:complete len:352 (+) Transcript_383:409-1464(+)